MISAPSEQTVPRAVREQDDEALLSQCVFQGGRAADDGEKKTTFSGLEYLHATDHRSLGWVTTTHTLSGSLSVVQLSGRHVGTLASVVATGRRFSTMAHIFITNDPGPLPSVTVESPLVELLTGSIRHDAQQFAESMAPLGWCRAAERDDLLDGQAEATHWARAWRLPPRLARLAVLLMAGMPARQIGKHLKLSVGTVGAYSQELFRQAKVQSRNELAVAALEAGRISLGAVSLGAISLGAISLG